MIGKSHEIGRTPFRVTWCLWIRVTSWIGLSVTIFLFGRTSELENQKPVDLLIPVTYDQTLQPA